MVTIDNGFEGTKVIKCLKVYHAHKAIAGGVFPDHFIDVGKKIRGIEDVVVYQVKYCTIQRSEAMCDVIPAAMCRQE